MLQRASIAAIPSPHQQTVPRSLVHKHSPENVLVTQIAACGPGQFVCGGRIPVDHGFLNDAGRSPRTDILFYTELGRQASIAISHAFLDVGTEDVFIFEGSEAALCDGAWRSAGELDLVTVEITIREIERRRNNAVNRVVAEHRMWVGDQEVCRASAAWTIQPAALFKRLRRTAVSAPPETNVLPFGPPANVVITPATAGADGASVQSALIVDQRHPYFFDHPCDHVPGMLLLEGCAQLAMAAHASYPLSRAVAVRAYKVNFTQFVECGVPTTLIAQVNADHTVDITISQRDVPSGTVTMHVGSAVTA